LRLARQLPNLLTIGRLILVPILGMQILAGRYWEAAVLFALASFTDFLDGILARRYGWGTPLGAVLDPLADKSLLVVTFLCLGAAGALPRWLVALVVGRDIFILLLAGIGYFFNRVRKFPPSIWGKWSTTFQMFCGMAAIADRSVLPGMVPMGPFIFFAAAGTVVSGVHYFLLGISHAKSRRPEVI
jgi:cardiolipin synthase (CMP-forming)